MACCSETFCLLQGAQSITSSSSSSSATVGLRHGFRSVHIGFFSSRTKSLLPPRPRLRLLRVQSVSTAPDDCNEEDCAPEKEVGKLSMEWKAEENTKVSGTYPPINKGKSWTGYVEKDTAGQTNIYAVEPTVYVSENAISSNTAGDSESGSEQTLLVAIGSGLTLFLVAGVVLQWVNSSNDVPSFPSSSSSLSFYIQKFKQEVNSISLPPPPALPNVDADSLAPATAPDISASAISETPLAADAVEPPASSADAVETPSSSVDAVEPPPLSADVVEPPPSST